MSFVIDASMAAVWAFDDEDHPVAALALQRVRDGATAPSLWWYEIRNIVVVNERRKRLTEIQSAAFLAALAQLPVQIDRAPVEGAILSLARRHLLTVYDAAYLELAQRLGLPLATLDTELIAAAKAASTPLLGH